MKKYKLIFFLLANFYCFGQDDMKGRILLNGNSTSIANYYIYNPTFKAKIIFNSINQVKNDYPEELMSSIISASSQEWEDMNTLGGALESDKKTESEFLKVTKLDKNLTYFELLAKLEFVANGSEMAVIKFNLHQEKQEKPIVGCLVLQKENGKWKKTSKPSTTNISTVLLVFKGDVLGRIIKNKGINEIENKIIKLVYDNDGVNFDLFLNLELTSEEKEYLTNPLNW